MWHIIDLAGLPEANRYLAGLMSGLDLRYDLDDPDPLVGARMVDVSLWTETGYASVSTLLRHGHGLLLELGDRRASPTPLPERVDRVVARVIDSPAGTVLGAAPDVDRPSGWSCVLGGCWSGLIA